VLSDPVASLYQRGTCRVRRGYCQAQYRRRIIEGDAVSEMLTDYYGGDVPGAALTPPRDPAKLRAGLARLDALRKSAFALAVLLGNITETESDDHRFVGGCQGRSHASPTVIEILNDSGEAQHHTDSSYPSRNDSFCSTP